MFFVSYYIFHLFLYFGYNYRATICVSCVTESSISSRFQKSCIFVNSQRANFHIDMSRSTQTSPTVFASIPALRFAPIIIAVRHLFISPWLTSYSRFHDFINTACMWYTRCWSSSQAYHPRDNTSIELLLKNKTTRNRPLIINFTLH